MDDQRRTAVREERVGAIAHVHTHICYGRVRHALGIDREVHHVAGVWSFRILCAVHLAVGIEMRTGGLECWTFTLRHLVKMYPVLTRRQVLQSQFDSDSFARL